MGAICRRGLMPRKAAPCGKLATVGLLQRGDDSGGRYVYAGRDPSDRHGVLVYE